MTVRWTFSDTTSSYTMEVNPNSGGSPQRTRELNSQQTTAPDGTPITFEGAPMPPTGEFGGVLLSQAQYNAFVSWFDPGRQLTMVDDLGRSQDVLLTSILMKSAPRRRSPWRHTYTVAYVLLSVESIP